MSRGGAERGGDRIPSKLCAASTEPDAGLEFVNHEIMTEAEIKSQMFNQLSHPGAPLLVCLFVCLEREREREREREGTRERQRERRAGSFCTLGAEPDVGLKFTNREIMT